MIPIGHLGNRTAGSHSINIWSFLLDSILHGWFLLTAACARTAVVTDIARSGAPRHQRATLRTHRGIGWCHAIRLAPFPESRRGSFCFVLGGHKASLRFAVWRIIHLEIRTIYLPLSALRVPVQ